MASDHLLRVSLGKVSAEASGQARCPGNQLTGAQGKQQSVRTQALTQREISGQRNLDSSRLVLFYNVFIYIRKNKGKILKMHMCINARILLSTPINFVCHFGFRNLHFLLP